MMAPERYEEAAATTAPVSSGIADTAQPGSAVSDQGEILERKRDSVMYRTWHEPMLASMGMPKAILYYTCII